MVVAYANCNAEVSLDPGDNAQMVGLMNRRGYMVCPVCSTNCDSKATDSIHASTVRRRHVNDSGHAVFFRIS